MRVTHTCVSIAGIAFLSLPVQIDTPLSSDDLHPQPGISGTPEPKAYQLTETALIPAPAIPASTPVDVNENNGLPPTAILWGTVQTENGVRVPGAKIRLSSISWNSSHAVVSDESGDFLFDGLLPSPDYRISISSRGMYKRYQRQIEVEANETYSDVILEELAIATLAGRVVDVNGNPVAHFRLSLRSNVKPTWSRHVVTDTLGEFHIPGFPLGGYEVSSMSDLLLNITGLRFNSDTDPVELTVDSGEYSVSGRVYDHLGNPLAGAGIFLDWTLTRGETRNFTARRTITDPGGRFSIEGLGEGLHDFLLVANRESVYRRVLDLGRESGYLDVVMEVPTLH
jgi:hypothetical protein